MPRGRKVIATKKERKPRISKAASKIVALQGYGPEPSFGGEQEFWSNSEYQLAVTKAYTWYNVFLETDDCKKAVIEYTKNKDLTVLEPWKFSPTVAALCKMIERGFNPSKETKKFFDDKIKLLTNEAKIGQVLPVVKKSVQDRIKSQVGTYVAEIDEEIDKFILAKYSSDFSLYAWLEKKQVKADQAKRLAEKYGPLLNELQLASKGKLEGYENLKKLELKRYVEFIKSLVDDANVWSGNKNAQKKARKPRAKKVKSPTKVVSKIKYLKEYKALKLASIDPTKIIGADQVWLFNTKYRNLTVLQSNVAEGLSVKGSTIYGFDEKSSMTKKLRKPEIVVPDILNNGKRANGNTFKALKVKLGKTTGRVNGDTIILKVNK